MTIVLLLPLIATLGEFVDSGFMIKRANIALLFWPGSTFEIVVNILVFVPILIIFVLYVVGIGYLFRKLKLGKAILIGVISFVVAQVVASIVNGFFGWKELQDLSSLNLSGKADQAILAQWYNAFWEEVVFRGLPLVLLVLGNRLKKDYYKLYMVLYLILPTVLQAMYHVPNHGYSRITDTLIFGVVMAWLTLRFSFFCPLVLHSVLNGMSVLSFYKIKSIPVNEIPWLIKYSDSINFADSKLKLGLLVLIPILIILNYRKIKEAVRHETI